MGSRNVLTVLSVIFVAVILYNVLYFTGVLGDFGGSTGVQAPEQDPRFDVPGLNPEGRAPQPSLPRQDGSQMAAPTTGARGRISAAELGSGGSWGRNPFLTPQEIWAVQNFRPAYTTQPAIPPSGLYISAIVVDSTGRRVAVVNGEIVSVGEMLGGMQVVDMMDDAVVLESEGQRHVIRMGDMEISLSSSGGTAGRY